ncbi:circadian clock protein KaiB [Flavobacterium sp. ANB]|uniref:circadian clock KaiB family protein n=1 Tax=unclassified Flavobacterium TaxID=196869 RepID=UPI0012B6B24F|nr:MULTISPECIES: circadian clock KaiB family protein [unclassified Flavobacterium]MBF4515654.1 circadian clock protein KaiB [Flavobacterium sp. ANB]MTD68657.1 circadian clock protein KaiB [Flavobacterium sp. LC2016-13]
MDNSSDDSSSTRHKFMLFVSGMSVKSGHAIENLRRVCDKYLAENYELEIIDISRDTEQAVLHQIVAIPTLIKTNPAPRRIILGDLSDKEKVLRILNLSE